MASDIKGIPLAPLTGTLDLRSSPDSLDAGSLRYRGNLQCTGPKKLRRGTGWDKLLNTSNYNNQDFHDQLLTFTPGGIRQPVTMLHNARSSRGVTSLLLATQGKIAQLNQHSGNWRILGSGFGGTQTTSAAAPRFKAARVGDYVAFTNDFDKPKYIILEESTYGLASLIHDFDDLPLIGLARAAIIWSWQNCLFFADVEMDAQRYGFRLLWSDYGFPASFDPAKINSITGFKDLFSHERILGGKPAGPGFLIYTTHGIWEMTVVGGQQSFAFRRAYDAEDNDLKGTLAYPNCILNTADPNLYGAASIYAAKDGIYEFNQYFGRPQRIDWLHQSTPILYDNIDEGNCQVHVAGQFGDEILLSFASKNALNHCPDITLRVNLAYKVADVVDFGFTCFENFESYDVPTVRDFIVENRICTLAGLAAAGYPYVKEGLPRPLPVPLAAFAPDEFYTDVTQVVAGVTVEDWNQPTASPDSLCALLGSERLDDVCRKCKGELIFVGASSVDWCLKQLGKVFYRERCVNPSALGVTDANGYTSAVGSYLLDGYDSILRFAPAFIPEALVQFERLQANYLAKAQTPPSLMTLRIGISAQPADPNTDDCGIVWHQLSSNPLKCLTGKTAEQHRKDDTQPSLPAYWNFLYRGRVIHVEWKLSGVGGDALFSGFIDDLKRSGEDY